MPDEYISPAGNDITPACLEYLRPLVGRARVRPLAAFRVKTYFPCHFQSRTRHVLAVVVMYWFVLDELVADRLLNVGRLGRSPARGR